MFESEFFTANREVLRKSFPGTAPIVITAHGVLQRTADNSFPFHQDSNFWYLTGLNHPDLVLVMDKDKEYLIVPGRSDIHQLFDGEMEVTSLKAASGINTILSEKEGWKRLSTRLKRTKHVATLAAPTPYLEHYNMYANPARAHLLKRLKEINDGLEFLDLRPHLMRARMVKQPQELAAIQKAIDITVKTFKEVSKPQNLAKLQYEYELEAAITAGFRKQGAQGHAFDPIVASGKHACTIHYMENNGELANNQLVVLDVGAQVSHYAADITRTVIKGKATKRQRAVVTAVKDVLEYGLTELKPGVSFKAAEAKLTEFMGEKLRELGLIKTIDKESIRRYYPHAPHFLGLDVHDVGDYDQPLEAGMVLTIEPGIYIPEEGIGVRIEDDVLITKKGTDVLSKALSRELQ